MKRKVYNSFQLKFFMDNGDFINPELFRQVIKKRKLSGPNGWLLFVACNQGLELARKVKREYETLLKKNGSELKEIPLINDSVKKVSLEGKITRVFEDTETSPRLPEHVAGSNAFVFQSVHELQSGNTVNENFMQLLQVVRSLREHSSKTITAVVPYSPSSRQEKPTAYQRESILARLNADLLIEAGISGVLYYHLHADSIRGFYKAGIKFTSLNGLDLFIDTMDKRFHGREDVICVSTDSGAAKSTVQFADALGVEYAIGNKLRPKQEKTDLIGIIGNLKGKKIAVIGDDESVTVSSLMNIVKWLYDGYTTKEGEHISIKETYILISHNKIRPEHLHKLIKAHERYGLREFHVTDTIPQTDEVLSLPFIRVHSLAERFARTINRLHYNQSVSKLFYQPKE